MSKLALKVSSKLSLPLDACTQTMAFIGKRGAGKTYSAGVLVEELLDTRCQVVVLDPVGTWYGLRMLSNGRSSAYNIPVLGGLRGDIGLTPESGELVAEMVVSTRTSVVLDVSNMLDAEMVRFTEKFVSRFHHAMKASPAPVHMVFEEAQLFAPQLGERGERMMLNRMKRLIKLGRNCGIGVSLLSQRPQAIHKGVLNQTEMLVAFQLTGTHERKAVKAWMTDKDLDVDLVAELPHLKVGDCWVWSPSWLDVTKKIRFRKKTTMDASATPKFGAKTVQPKSLSKTELGKLEKAMGKAAEDAKAKDPKHLRRRILQLERELAAKKPTPAKEKVKEVVKEVSVFTAADRKALQLVVKAADKTLKGLSPIVVALSHLEGVMSKVDNAGQYVSKPPTLDETVKRHRTRLADVAVTPHPMPLPGPGLPPPADTNGLSKRHIEIIGAVYRQGRPVTKVQLAALVGLKHTGGTYNTYLSRCRTSGMLVGDGSSIQVTAAGAKLAADHGHEQLPDNPEDIYGMWLERLQGRTKDILTLLWSCYPDFMTKEQVADRLEMEVKGGTFNTYLSRLSSLRLIQRQSGSVAINGETFLLE